MLLNIQAQFNKYNNNRIITQIFTWQYEYSVYNTPISNLIIAELKGNVNIFKDNHTWRPYWN